MKMVTEFPGYMLSRAAQAKKASLAEGKSPEEVEAGLGATFKLEGEKLKHLSKTLEVIGDAENIKRIMVMTVGEGENAPPHSTKVDEFYYVKDIPVLTGSKPGEKPQPKGRRGGGKGQGQRPKESPWGLSPEEKAAKNAKKPVGKPS